MKKYIDADLLKAEFTGNLACEYPAPLVKALIDNQPVADVAEVVRCKDCKYARKEKEVFGIADFKCLKTLVICLDADDFCSYGERRRRRKNEV